MQRQKNRTIICVLEINAFHSLHAICMLDMSHFHRFSLEHCWRHSILQYNFHLRQQSSSTFKQQHVFQPGKNISPSAATGILPAVPRHLHCLSKDQTGENLMQWGQGCKVSVATPSILWWPQCCTHFWQFSYGTKVSIQTSYCFIIFIRVYCCVCGQEFQKNNTLLNPEDCSHHCSCWWHTLEFLLPLLCHLAHHSLNSCLDSGSEW